MNGLSDAANINWMALITLPRVLWALTLILFASLLVRVSDSVLEALAQAAPRARFFFKMLAPLVRFLLTMAAFILIVKTFAPTPQALVALTASVGIAVGLGAQDLVKNVLGGVIILTDRPYQLGDRVKIGEAYGEIDHIGIRSTKMTTPDDTRVTIPNSDILTGQIFNANSGVPDCQVVTDLFLPHNTDPKLAEEIGLEAAASSPYLLHRKPIVVLLTDMFQESPYLRLRIKAYVYDHRFEPRFQSDITARAKTEFRRRGLLDWNQDHVRRHAT